MNSSTQDQRLYQLATRPVGRLLWEYSLPAVVGMLVMSLYNVVDRVFIGQCVGPDAIAGLAITFPIMNLSAAVGVLIGAGATARISIALGEKNMPLAEKILGNALTLTVVNAVIYIGLFALFMDPMLHLFGASDATLPYARTYLMPMLPGLLFTNISFSFNNIMRASGYPRKAMYTMLIGALVNIALVPLFVYVFDWGIAGAAYATDIAMIISAIFVMSHFFRRDATLTLRRGTFVPARHIVVSVVTLGAAPSLVNAASSIINAIINNSLLFYGSDRDIGAAGIMVTYTSLLTMTVLGICQGLQPILGYNYGARHFGRLRRTFLLAVGASMVITTLGAVFGLLFPREVGMAFSTDPGLLDATEIALGHCLFFFPFVGFQIVSTTLFQSIGMAGKSVIVSLMRQIIFLIPLLLLLPRALGLRGVWLSFPSSDFLATVFTFVLVVMQMRVISKMSQEPVS